MQYAIALTLALGVASGNARRVMPAGSAPTPPLWPSVVHGVLIQNMSGNLAIVDLYYDFPKGHNLNLIRGQHDDDPGAQGELWDVEFDNRSSFYYYPRASECTPMNFSVGILRPDWLVNATFLGVEPADNYAKCNVWTKSDGFITYWEDAQSRRPVKWVFGTGMSEHVMQWREGEALPDDKWQIPAYCFNASRSGAESTAGVASTRRRARLA